LNPLSHRENKKAISIVCPWLKKKKKPWASAITHGFHSVSGMDLRVTLAKIKVKEAKMMHFRVL